ncbi:DUF4112 domain-containing protein [Dietzia sp. UBA5065]|jgi:hypothetical protein|uniref:DUF4112 domain-containing protein n=1 Tax=Dietzia sp. UBA5065 TaxID=1946422 RepID=UPI0025C3BF28|nr:DUF4112 domain-containing protein [Dietzia sp. UBA5065]HMT50139.1 DUF4112 domain-containing protein [Dietzia sp.]
MTVRPPDPVPAARAPVPAATAVPGSSPVTSGLARVLDDLVRIPGTRYRVGVDPVIGFVPVVGDAVGTVVAAAVLIEAIRNRVPVRILFRMGWNYVVDAVLGTIPFVGDVADIAHKATSKNLRLVDRTIAEGRTVDTDARGYLLRAVGAVGLMLLVLLGMAAFALWVLLRLIGLF